MKRKKSIIGMVLAAAVLLVLVLMGGASAATSGPFTFGVVLVGPYNDHGWSEAHFTAGKYVEGKIPGAKMIWLDKLNPADRKGTTLDQVVSDMIGKGAKLIFTTSDDFKDETRLAAKKYPEVTFIQVSGDDVWTGKATKNLGNYMGRMEYTKMIAGCAAAMSTQTGKIGYLGPLINDETRRLVAAAYLGAKYAWTNYRGKKASDLKFDVKWIGFWFNIPGVTLDPTKVANDFFTAGTDVLMSGIDTNEALVQAGKKSKEGMKVSAVPYDFKEACKEAPWVCLGVPYFNWGPGYLKLVKAWRAGTWKQDFEWTGPDWKNINNPDTSAVGFLPGPALKGEALAKVEDFIKGLASGKIVLFQGPLKFQDGSVFLKEGQKANDKQVWYLPQLLEGMTGPSK
jgi:simple sugar transport system substrate-binding protein